MSVFATLPKLFEAEALPPEAKRLYLRHCYAASSQRARLGYSAMLVLLCLLILAVDVPAYLSGELFSDSVMQQMFWWRICFIGFICLVMSLNAVLVKPEVHDAVFSWTSVLALPIIGALYCVICRPMVPDVSLFVLFSVAVAAVLPLASRWKLLIYPVSLALLLAGLRLHAYDPASFSHSAVIAITGATGAVLIDLLARYGFRSDFAKTRLLVSRERQSTELIEEVFPPSIAEQLSGCPLPICQQHPAATLMFAEFAGFSALTRTLSAEECMSLLDQLFVEFEEAAARFGVEKIKTSGDCFVAACGVLAPVENHVERVAELALRLRSIAQRFRSDRELPVHLRIGIHTGPVLSGVVGRRRYAFDLWGPSVDLASQLRARSMPGGIHVSAATRDALGRDYSFSAQEPIRIRDRAPVQTYYLLGRAIDRDAIRESMRLGGLGEDLTHPAPNKPSRTSPK